MIDVIFVGGGGHASVLLDIARADARLRVVGYVAPQPGLLSRLGVAHLGGDDHAPALLARGVRHAVLGAAGVAHNERRRALFEAWSALGFEFVTLVHRSAVVSVQAPSGSGLQAMAASVVNPGATLGRNVIVNTGAIVEHDCVVEDHAHVGPGAVLCGGVRLGAGALVGAGATVLPGVSIARGALVAAGSAVTRDVADSVAVAGVPARPIASRSSAPGTRV
jgi:UDP-perosamine 4-acetyltransferase